MDILGASEGVPGNLDRLLFFSGLGRDWLCLRVTQDLEDVVEKESTFLALRP